jgi:hypothetical protein
MSLTLLDPTQAPEENPDASGMQLSPRLDTLNGKTIGLWNNNKLNAESLLEMISNELSKHYHFDVVRGTYDPSKLMPEDSWGDIDRCDVVILANGDCGACSTSGIANAIQLEARGIPAVLVGTTPFNEAIKTIAVMTGMPAMRWAIVDHPLASLGREELLERALDAARQLPPLMLVGDPG